MTIITPNVDEWPHVSYKLNEKGLIDNPNAPHLQPASIINLARFFFFNANDGLVDDLDEAATEIMNIMRGDFYIANTDGDEEDD